MTAGYSGTPQARKLGLRPGVRVAVVDAPAGWALTDPPEELDVVAGVESADVVIAFVRSGEELAETAEEQGRRIFPAGALWLAWPRRAAGHRSDITEDGIRAAVLPLGLVDVKIAALDNDWSALKVVWRVEHRTNPPAARD
jgi:hypothetical protein